MRHLRFSLSLLLLTLLSSRVTLAQTPNCYCDTAHWKYCSTPFSGQYSLLFLNGRIGYGYLNALSVNEWDARAVLFRTSDSGMHWEQIDSTPYGIITDLSFLSTAHGYATTVVKPYGYTRSGGLYETWDSGYSWHLLSFDSTTGYGSARASGDYVISVSSQFIESFDGGHTWRPALSAFQQPNDYVGDRLFSNRSGTIATIGSHRSEQRIIATSDDGQTWNAFPVSPALISTLYIPPLLTDKSRSVFISNGVVQRDLNLGSTWDTVLKKSNLVADIEGAGCAMYINQKTGSTVGQGSSGLFYRSTNLGNTWQVMTTPAFSGSNLGQRYFNVVGHGSTVYVLSGAGDLWRTTDGGDGTLGPNMDTHITYVSYTSPALSSGADTLRLTLCDSASISLQFQYVGSCSSARLDHVSISGLDSSEYHVNRIRHTATQDSAFLTILPSKAGMRSIAVHAIYINDELEEHDTSLALTFRVDHSPSTLHVDAPKVIDFGTQSIWLAQKRTDTFSVSAAGCESLTVKSIALVAFPSSSGFEFKNVTSFVATTTPRSFPISYKPIYAETDSALILITYITGASQQVDTIRVVGEGTDNSNLSVSESNEYRALTYDIFDVLGKRVRNDKVNKKESLNLADLNQGVYFIRLSDGNMISFKKIVVTR